MRRERFILRADKLPTNVRVVLSEIEAASEQEPARVAHRTAAALLMDMPD
jgi:hypothetical protein